MFTRIKGAIRDASGSLKMKISFKAFVLSTIVILITAGFLLFGITDYITSSGNTVAKIAGNKISYDEYNQSLNSKKREFIAMYGTGIIEKLLNTNNFKQLVLNELIDQKLIEAELNDMKIIIDDSVIKEFVLQSGIFRRGDVMFDQQIFQTYMQQKGLSETDFIRNQKINFQQIAFNDLLSIINRKDLTAIAKKIITQQSQKRLIAIASFPIQSGKSDENQYSEGDIINYYNQNKEQFTNPEQRLVKYIDISKYIDATHKIEVQDSDILEYYRENYLSKSENISFYKIQFTSKAELQKAMYILNNDKISITDLAKQILKIDAKDFYYTSQLSDIKSEKLKHELSTMKSGSSKEFFEDNSYFILSVDKISNNSIDIANVRQEIINILKLHNRCGTILSTTNSIEDEINSGSNISDIMEKFSIPKSFLAEQTLSKEAQNITIPSEILTQIVTSDKNEQYGNIVKSKSETDSCKYYAYQVYDTSKEKYKPLEEVRGTIVTKLVEQSNKDNASRDANKFRNLISDGSGSIATQIKEIQVNKHNTDFDDLVTDSIFQAKKDDTLPVLFNEKTNSYIVIQVKNILDAQNVKMSEQEVLEMSEKIAKDRLDTFKHEYLQYLRAKFNVKVNQNFLTSN